MRLSDIWNMIKLADPRPSYFQWVTGVNWRLTTTLPSRSLAFNYSKCWYSGQKISMPPCLCSFSCAPLWHHTADDTVGSRAQGGESPGGPRWAFLISSPGTGLISRATQGKKITDLSHMDGRREGWGLGSKKPSWKNNQSFRLHWVTL